MVRDCLMGKLNGLKVKDNLGTSQLRNNSRALLSFACFWWSLHMIAQPYKHLEIRFKHRSNAYSSNLLIYQNYQQSSAPASPRKISHAFFHDFDLETRARPHDCFMCCGNAWLASKQRKISENIFTILSVTERDLHSHSESLLHDVFSLNRLFSLASASTKITRKRRQNWLAACERGRNNAAPICGRGSLNLLLHQAGEVIKRMM